MMFAVSRVVSCGLLQEDNLRSLFYLKQVPLNSSGSVLREQPWFLYGFLSNQC